MTSDFEWLSRHGNYTEDQHAYFAQRVIGIMDSVAEKTPAMRWQAQMLAWQELRVKAAEKSKKR